MTRKWVEDKVEDMYDCVAWVRVRHSLFSRRKVWFIRLLGSTLSLHESIEKPIALEYSVIGCKIRSHLLPWSFTLKLSDGTQLRISFDFKSEAKTWREALLRASNVIFQDEFKLLEKIEETDGTAIFNAVDKFDESKVMVQRIVRDPFDALHVENTSALARHLYAIKNLGYHNLLWALDTFHEADYAYIVSRRVKGKRLSQVISEHGGSLSESTARYIAKQLVQAVSYMHLKGFVHRRVTLDSVWYDCSDMAEPRIVLSDFSDVAFVDDEEDLRMHNTVGDIRYRATEIVKGISYNAAVDLFSLGVCTYRMLCGSFPFNDNLLRKCKIIEDRERELSFKEDAWKGVSEEAKAFVTSLLQPYWLDRSTADEAEGHPWFEMDIPSPGEKRDAERIKPTVVRKLESLSSGIERAPDGESVPKSTGSLSRANEIQALLKRDEAKLSPFMRRLLSPLSAEAPLSVKSAVDTFASTLKDRNIAPLPPS